MATARGILAILTAMLASGCLYTDSINTPPQAQLELGDTRTYYRGTDTISFHADKSSDADGDRLFYEFRAELCGPDGLPPCAPADELAADRTQLSVDLPSLVPGTEIPVGFIRAAVIVTDGRGAFSMADVEWQVASQEPVVLVQDQLENGNSADSYEVAEPVYVVASFFDDNQDDHRDISDLTIDWQVTARPDASTDFVFEEVIIDDPGAGNQRKYRLVPDVTGTWEVSVTATDSAGATTTTPLLISVTGDQPACLGGTDPGTALPVLVDATGPSQIFQVLEVIDVSDPYPYPPYDPQDPDAGASFTWLLRAPGETTFAPVGGDTPELALDPTPYLPGDVLDVRVEVSDRSHSPACDPAEDTCSIDDNGCLQRVTWEVEIR